MQFPSIDDFRFADAGTLHALYEDIFFRIAAREKTLRVFPARAPKRERVIHALETLLAEYPEPSARPPLFGVPLGVKALFRLDGEDTSVGSLLPADLFAGPEATLVAAARKAGAVILGHTATTEFASSEPAATCNPHNEAHTPGGSSSGSAAGVAAGFFPLAFGTQTIGSVARPASFCGVVGFKPSYGTLPTEGIVYFSHSADHAGLFTATVTDAATAFYALLPERKRATFSAPVKIGVPVGPYLDQATPETMTHLLNALSVLAAKSGGTIDVVNVPCFEDLPGIAALHHDLINAEFAREQADFFPRYEGLYRPRTAANIRYGLGLGADAVERGKASQLAQRDKLGLMLDEYSLSAFVTPSAVGEADKGLLFTGDPCMNMPWTHTGMPTITMPMGTGKQGVPLGMQLAGRFGDDDALLALAGYLESL